MFGSETFDQIKTSEKLSFAYAECGGAKDLGDAIAAHQPDVLIFNHHPTTMSWAPLAAAVCDLPTIGIVHEATSEMADHWDGTAFDVLVTHDPDLQTTNPNFIRAPRPIPTYRPSSKPPADGPVTIGTFGFPEMDKGFADVVRYAQESFANCRVRIHIPSGDFSSNVATEVIESCKNAVARNGVELEFRHEFLSRDDLIEFLASNHLNAFLYAPERGAGGISSTTDWALSAARPFALRRGKMFRHFRRAKPSVFVDDLSFAQILQNGLAPLEPFRREWSSQAVARAYEGAVDRVIALRADERTWRAGFVNRAFATVEAQTNSLATERTFLLNAVNTFAAERAYLLNAVNTLENALSMHQQLLKDSEARIQGLQNRGPSQSLKGALHHLSGYVRKVLLPLRSFGASGGIAGFKSEIAAVHQASSASENSHLKAQPPKVGRFNTLLDDAARRHYAVSIEELWDAAPEMMKRKIKEANVQQGYMLTAVDQLAAGCKLNILSVGSFEDTACVALKSRGHVLDEVDPVLNCDLATFLHENPDKLCSYPIVFSTSVIEHVEDDEAFVRDMLRLTAPGGAIVLTCDYCNGWSPDQQKPSSNKRIYTRKDMSRLITAMGEVELIDEPDWDNHDPDFAITEFGREMRYGFATLAVRKQ